MIGGFERKEIFLVPYWIYSLCRIQLCNILNCQPSMNGFLRLREVFAWLRAVARVFAKMSVSFSTTVPLDRWTSSVVDGKYLVLPFFLFCSGFFIFFALRGSWCFQSFYLELCKCVRYVTDAVCRDNVLWCNPARAWWSPYGWDVESQRDRSSFRQTPCVRCDDHYPSINTTTPLVMWAH